MKALNHQNDLEKMKNEMGFRATVNRELLVALGLQILLAQSPPQAS